jgi:cell wall-associated NlpC family hydrolase
MTGILAAPASSADQAKIEQVEAYLTDLEMQAAAAHGRLEDAEYTLAQITSHIESTQIKVDEAKAQLSETQSSIGRYAAAAYRTGGIDSSLQLLLADDPQEFLDSAAILDIVANSQNAALRNTQVARLNLAQISAQLAQQQDEAEALVVDVQALKADFDGTIAETQTYLAQLEEEERQRLEEERRRKEAEAKAAAEAALAAQQAAAQEAAAREAAVQEAAAQEAAAREEAQSNSDASGSPSTNAPSSGSSGSTTSENGGPDDGGSFTGGLTGGTENMSERAAIAVSYALAQVGKPYSFAAQPPNSWDCTKLTAAAWAQAGVRLTPYSYVQAREVRQISTNELQPGDLLFFFKNGAHHASMYIGGGQIVEAASPQSGVRITAVWNAWNVAHFSWAGRPY